MIRTLLLTIILAAAVTAGAANGYARGFNGFPLTSAMPETVSLLLVGGGLMGIGLIRRSRG